MFDTLVDLEERYNDVQNQINNLGYSFDIYKYNIRILKNVGTVEDFLIEYNKIQEEGRNTIDLEKYINSKGLLINENTSLETLHKAMWRAVIEYSETELEYMQDEEEED